MRRLRAGVIGLGVGEQHIDGYRRSVNTEVVALCDMDPKKQAMAREKYPDCEVYASADEIIDAPGIDVLSIASFDHHHAEQVIRALDSGKHVFCEKPLCQSELELSAICDALRRNPECRLSTNTVLRMSPRFRDLRQSIQENKFGRLYYLEADYNYGRLHKLKEGWRGRIMDYSVMFGGGVHMVDLLLWLSGGRVIEVVAMANKICSEGFGFRTPDMVVALLKFEDGMVAKVSANFGCVFPHFHKLMVYGTAATFENDFGAARMFVSRDDKAVPIPVETPYPGLRKGDLILGFIDVIRAQAKSAIEEDEVIATMAVCFAIDRSWQERKPVQVVIDNLGRRCA